MKTLPADIEKKIDQLFNNLTENVEAKKIMDRLKSTTLNVGKDQLARSILTISEGNIQTLKSIFEHKFMVIQEM